MTADSVREQAVEESPGTAECTLDCTADVAGRLLVRLGGAALPPAEVPSTDGSSTGRPSGSGPGPGPRLLLVLRPLSGRPEETSHVFDLEPGDDGRWRTTLDLEPALPEGRWDPYLLAGPGEPRRRLRPGLLDLRALVTRGEHADPSLPLAVRIPYVTVDRSVAVRTWLRTAHAEAGEIHLGDGSLTVRGRLYGAPLGDGATGLLRRRGGGEIREVPLRADGERDFAFTVEHRELPAVRKGEHDIWDAFVRPHAATSPAEARGPGWPSDWVRVGRLLDDVADRKNIFVYPAVTRDGVTVHPYYTVDNELAVELTAASERRTGWRTERRAGRARSWRRSSRPSSA